MLTKVTIRNFKRFVHAEVELGSPVVFIGPNDSGKTSVLQALTLWDIGFRRWNEKRSGKTAPEKRPGVTINRRDLISLPVPDSIQLWHELHVRDVRKASGKQSTTNIRVDVLVEGISQGRSWKCGFEFDYANNESFYCRPLRITKGTNPKRMPVPEEAGTIRMAFLPPMSGLAAREDRLDLGAIKVHLGEGRTAEVLRNLCYQILQGHEGEARWRNTCIRIRDLFGIELDEPGYIPQRGEIAMTYRNRSGIRLDLSSSGRGFQQTLLLLAHLSVNPNSVLLLDEPDAHLEILRQRQIYHLLVESARESDSQIIAASHSEVVLNEAADRDVVVAFVGKPHRIDDRGSQVLKALDKIGFDQYYQAEQTGWVLYVEGSTDLAILQAFAERLEHAARKSLARPFVHYVTNLPNRAYEHFRGLREAKPDLLGFALFDRIEQQLQGRPELREHKWHRREIENYICSPETLMNFAEGSVEEGLGPLFAPAEKERRRNIMQECIEEFVPKVAYRNRNDRWWIDTKASNDFLERVLEAFFRKLDLPPGIMNKSDFHILARYVPTDQIDAEVSQVLDGIAEVANQAKPLS